MKKIRIFGIIFILIVVLVFIFSVFNKSKNFKNKIRIGYLPIVAHAPVFVIDSLKGDSLDIELIKFSSSNQIMNALISDQIDIAYELSTDVAINALSNGGNYFKIYQISIADTLNPIDGIAVRNESKIKTLDSVTDMTKIGIFPGPTAKEMFIQYMKVKFKKENNKDYQLSQLPPQTEIGALKSGVIDFLFTYEPIITIIESNNYGYVIDRGLIEKNVINPWPGGVGLISTRLIERSPQSASSYVKLASLVFKKISKNREILDNIINRKKEYNLNIDIIKKLPIISHASSLELINNPKVLTYMNTYQNFLYKHNIISKEINFDKIIYKYEEKQ